MYLHWCIGKRKRVDSLDYTVAAWKLFKVLEIIVSKKEIPPLGTPISTYRDKKFTFA